MNRNRLPRWINATIDLIADSPTSLLGRIAARRLGRPEPAGEVGTTEFGERPTRVLIAPVNYSGQGREWARALEASDPDISARNMAIDVPGGFSFDADLVVPVGTYHNGREWQIRQFRAATTATHVLVEAEEPPFGRLHGRSVHAQVEALARAGVSVAFLAHGTDVRLPSRHRMSTRWSHYNHPSVYAPRAEALARRNIRLIEDSGCPAFVSTPDLLEDLPDALWCPVVIDPGRWDAPRSAMAGPLRVVHAPSVSHLKGTELIAPVLESLAAEGIIELRIVQGVPSARMPEVFSSADVVIDQMRAGSYGVAACEAMAAGCVVVGHITHAVRRAVQSEAGRELPIVEADPDTIEEVLRGLARTPDLHPLRQSGREFVRSVHDGRRSADVLLRGWIRPDVNQPEKGRERAPLR